jgi:ParB family chromosome partitioning protein
MGHARALLALDAAQQIMAANQVAAKKLSVREAEKLVARLQSGAAHRTPRAKADKPRDVERLEERLADALTAPVEIRLQRRTARGQAGEVVIRFGSLDELDGLLERFGAREP